MDILGRVGLGERNRMLLMDKTDIERICSQYLEGLVGAEILKGSTIVLRGNKHSVNFDYCEPYHQVAQADGQTELRDLGALCFDLMVPKEKRGEHDTWTLSLNAHQSELLKSKYGEQYKIVKE